MNAPQFLNEIDKGLAGLDSVQARLDRLKHQANEWTQVLDEADAAEAAKPSRRNFLRTLLGGTV